MLGSLSGPANNRFQRTAVPAAAEPERWADRKDAGMSLTLA
jgi:hypothetical protein